MSNDKIDNKDNLPTLYTAKDLSTNFPKPIKQIKVEGEKTIDLIKNKGAYTQDDARAWIDRTAMPHLLATDSKGAKRVYNDFDDEDKYENGNIELASVEALQKVSSKRIQEPRDTLQRERLRFTEKCLIAFRDSPELEKIRELDESKNRKELPAIKKKMLDAAKVDGLTDDDLIDPEVHHKDRVADNPRRTLDETNLEVLNKSTHRNDIHANGIESEKEFEDYKNSLKS